MAVQTPVDYSQFTASIPDPWQKFEEGMAWAQKQKEMEKAKARQAQMEADYAALIAAPMTSAKMREFTLKYPEVGDKFKGTVDALSADEKKAAVQQFIPAATALNSGNTKVAEEQLRLTAEGYKNNGNAQMAKLYSDAADAIKISPSDANYVLSMVANAIDPEWAGKVDASRKTGAETLKIGAETRGMTADAIVKEAEAKFAPEKVAAELGLTQAQIEQARAAAAASRAAARNSDAQAAGANSALIPPEKRPELELKMRNEYASRTATYQDVKQAFGRVQASQESAAGDLALIFNYMKMLDPGSAVREGEFANAQNAASVPDRIRNMYNKLINGERLNTGQRKMFTSQAEALFKQAATGEKVVRDGISRIATGYGLNPSNIFYEAVETPPTPPAGVAPPPAAVAPPPSAATAGGVGSQVRHSVTY